MTIIYSAEKLFHNYWTSLFTYILPLCNRFKYLLNNILILIKFNFVFIKFIYSSYVWSSFLKLFTSFLSYYCPLHLFFTFWFNWSYYKDIRIHCFSYLTKTPFIDHLTFSTFLRLSHTPLFLILTFIINFLNFLGYEQRNR